MEIISIIEIEDNVVIDIKSFSIPDEKAKSEIVKKAEKLFKAKVIEIGAEEQDIDIYLEDGHFTVKNRSVCLVWS